jgi:hypothetical protein
VRIDEIDSHAKLIEFLEGFTAVNGDRDVYDVGCLISILGACLTNLARHSIDTDFEELDEVYEPAQIEVLRKLVAGCMPRQ